MSINPRVIAGAVAAAAVAIVGYLTLQGVLTIEIATAINVVIAAVAGYSAPAKS